MQSSGELGDKERGLLLSFYPSLSLSLSLSSSSGYIMSFHHPWATQPGKARPRMAAIRQPEQRATGESKEALLQMTQTRIAKPASPPLVPTPPPPHPSPLFLLAANHLRRPSTEKNSFSIPACWEGAKYMLPFDGKLTVHLFPPAGKHNLYVTGMCQRNASSVCAPFGLVPPSLSLSFSLSLSLSLYLCVCVFWVLENERTKGNIQTQTRGCPVSEYA